MIWLVASIVILAAFGVATVGIVTAVRIDERANSALAARERADATARRFVEASEADVRGVHGTEDAAARGEGHA